MAVRLANTLFAWRTSEYPGRVAMVAYVLGCSAGTAKRTMTPSGGHRWSTAQRARALAFLKAKRAAIDALISELSR